MGFKISWLAVENITKPALLDALRLADTGQEDEVNEAPFSAAELGNGWSLIFSNDFGWVEDLALASIPTSCRAIIVQVHEGIMYSRASGAIDGAEQWTVVHDAQEALTHLSVNGTPPELDAVRSALLAEQAADGSGAVDYAFDVPVEIAARLTGHCHSEWDLRTGPRPRFTAVVRSTVQAANG